MTMVKVAMNVTVDIDPDAWGDDEDVLDYVRLYLQACPAISRGDIGPEVSVRFRRPPMRERGELEVSS